MTPSGIEPAQQLNHCATAVPSGGVGRPLSTVLNLSLGSAQKMGNLIEYFSTAMPWHQLYRAARDSPGIDK